MGEINKGFTLPQKKVTVKFIKRNKGIAANVSENHMISGGLMEGAKRQFPVCPLRDGRSLKNPFTVEEKEGLEKIVGFDLSIYGDYMKKYYTPALFKTDNYLDLSEPDGYIAYKVLLTWSDVIASSLEEKERSNKPTYQFVIVEEGDTEKVKGKKASLKNRAWKLYNKYESDKNTLKAIILQMLGKRVGENADLDFLQDEVQVLVEERTSDFINLLEDVNFETICLINQAIQVGAIKKDKEKYHTVEGVELWEKGNLPSLSATVSYLNNPLNIELKDILEARINNATKKKK